MTSCPARHRQLERDVVPWDRVVPASTPTAASLYSGHRNPADIISRAVWLYFRFSLRLRDVEELMAERGVWVNRVERGCGARSAWRDVTHAGLWP